MGASRKPGDYARTPGRGALTYLKNLGAAQRGKKISQFSEGVVVGLVDGQHLVVRWPFASGPKSVRVRYSTCDASAFQVGDYVLCFARNCDVSQTEVIGFTRGPRPCGFEAQIFGLLGRHDPANPIFPEPKLGLQLVRVMFLDPAFYNASQTNVGPLISSAASHLGFCLEDDPASIDAAELAHGRISNYRRNPLFMNVSTQLCGWSYGVSGWTQNTTTGVPHNDHVHESPEGFWTPYHRLNNPPFTLFRKFPLTNVDTTLGDTGPSLNPFFIEYLTTHPQLKSVPGWTWNGLQYCVTTGKLTIMGSLFSGAGTGVLVVEPSAGFAQQIWSPQANSRTITTFTLKFATCTRNLTDPFIPDYSYSDDHGYSGYQKDHFIVDSFGNPVYPGHADDLSYGLAIGDTAGCISQPPDPAYPVGSPPHFYDPNSVDSWRLGVEVYNPFTRTVRFTSIDEEVLSGVPSPPIAVSPSTSYVLVPCLHRKYSYLIHFTPPVGWSPGSSPPAAAPDEAKQDRGGEVLREQRLYVVHVEGGTSSLVQNVDVTTTAFDTGSFTNEDHGQKTFVEIESRSFRRAFNYAPSGPSSPLQRWWNPINRPSSQGYPVGDPTTQIPFVSPGGFLHANPAAVGYPWQRPIVAGNWVPMDPSPSAPVAAWAFVWTAHEDTARLTTLAPDQSRQAYDQDYLGDSDAYAGDHFADYIWDAPRNPIAHGDRFCVYSANSGAELQQLIVGARTNPGSYLTCPTVTPDGTKMVFAAHGWFSIPPLGVRFFAGLYHVDRAPAIPIITFLSPCELRVPGRPTITALDAASGPTATGNEVGVALPDPTTILPTSDSYESQLAYFIGCRRKSFLNRSGTLLLAESGYMLDLTNVASPVLKQTGITNLTGLTDPSEVVVPGPVFQDVEQIYKGFIPPVFP